VAAATSSGDQLAKVAVLFVAVAMLNAFRRGEAGDWIKAKLWNFGDPTPATGPTLATLIAGSGLGVATGTSSTPGPASGPPSPPAGPDSPAAAGMRQYAGVWLSPSFGPKWAKAVAAAAADGITLTGSGWRSNKRQIELRIAHGCGGAKLYDANCKGSPPTARPGNSRHETGDAVDVNLTGAGGRQSPEYRWLAANASKFGIYNLPSEAWHWSKDGN
jgi:hypothetical protein